MGGKMKRFSSKKEAFDFFEEQISRAYEKIYEDKKLEYESYLLKSYLLEINILDLENKNRKEILKNLFSAKDKSIETDVYEIEPDFFELLHRHKESKISTYIEWISDRFLFLYTLSKSQKVDNLIHKIVQVQPRIDQFWFWDDFLNSQITKNNRYFSKT